MKSIDDKFDKDRGLMLEAFATERLILKNLVKGYGAEEGYVLYNQFINKYWNKHQKELTTNYLNDFSGWYTNRAMTMERWYNMYLGSKVK